MKTKRTKTLAVLTASLLSLSVAGQAVANHLSTSLFFHYVPQDFQGELT